MSQSTGQRLPRLELSEAERDRCMISVRQAAQLKGISKDTFQRHYSHLIQTLSPRRRGVRLGDLK